VQFRRLEFLGQWCDHVRESISRPLARGSDFVAYVSVHLTCYWLCKTSQQPTIQRLPHSAVTVAADNIMDLYPANPTSVPTVTQMSYGKDAPMPSMVAVILATSDPTYTAVCCRRLWITHFLWLKKSTTWCHLSSNADCFSELPQNLPLFGSFPS